MTIADELTLDELNQRASIYCKKINLMLGRGQISNADLKYIRLYSYPIAKRQWKLPPELVHLEDIYAATDIADFVPRATYPKPRRRSP